MTALTMSPKQRWAYDRNDVERMPVGIWRCPSGQIKCAEGTCTDECGCCENAGLWEAPFFLDPVCAHCGRKAFLVELVAA